MKKTKDCKDCGNPFEFYATSTIEPVRCTSCTISMMRNSRIEKRKKKADKDDEKPKLKRSTSRATTRFPKKKKSSESPKTKAMKKADLWFSRYIRLFHGNVSNSGDVWCRCIATGELHLAKNIDNGHFHSRGIQNTRYHLDNCRPQSHKSNRFRGEMDKPLYRKNLIAEIGEERMRILDELAAQYSTEILSVEYYNEIASKYKDLTNKLLKQKGANKWW